MLGSRIEKLAHQLIKKKTETRLLAYLKKKFLVV